MAEMTITLEAYAVRMGIAYWTALEWVKQGRVPGAKMGVDDEGKRRWFIPLSALKTTDVPKNRGRHRRLSRR